MICTLLEITPAQKAALDLYWAAKTPDEEHEANRIMVASGLRSAYASLKHKCPCCGFVGDMDYE